MENMMAGKTTIDVVFELGHLLNSPLEQRLVLEKVVEILGQFLNSDGCTLFLLKEKRQGQEFRLSAHWGEVSPQGLEIATIIKDSLSYKSLMAKKSILVENAKTHPLICKELNKITRAKTVMAVPMLVKGEPVGAISVYSRTQGCYTEEHLYILECLAIQIGTALFNVQLFEYTQQLTLTDGLTGLFDHNYFLRSLEVDIHEARKKSQELSLILADIDDFKYYNDLYGHSTGDLILKHVAQVLQQVTGEEYLTARYGGDEFVIILHNISKDEAGHIAEKVRLALEKELFLIPQSKRVCRVTASLGVATFPLDADSAKGLINSADRAMYRIKRSTKNKIQLYLSEFADLEQDFNEAEKTLFDTIRILIEILDSRDKYTWEHSRQVGRYAMAIAWQMGLEPEKVKEVRLAGYLHDIGKIHVNQEILNKRGRLTAAEYYQVKVHPVVGSNLLSPIEGFKNFTLYVRHHHEWFNGKGYPANLAGEEIPLGARILSVADGFDAMTSNRPYRHAMAVDSAREEIYKEKGRQYDPEVVEAFFRCLDKRVIKI